MQRTAWLLWRSVLIALGRFDAGLKRNPTPRLSLLLALVDHSDLHIDRYQQIPYRYLATGDISHANGHILVGHTVGESGGSFGFYGNALFHTRVTEFEWGRRPLALVS